MRNEAGKVFLYLLFLLYLSVYLSIIKKMKNKGFTLRKRLNSFRYAFNGIRLLIQNEHNAWIHCIITICVIISGFIFNLSATEWISIIIIIGIVFSAEAINSAIESISDLVSPEYNEHIKQTKDLAAGAVLIVAIIAVIIGLIIFIPKIIPYITCPSLVIGVLG